MASAMDYTTDSGLRVVERVKPRDIPAPRVDESNGNPPSTVGNDNLDPGRFVMYPWNRPPPQAQSWEGWPVEWNPPLWAGSSPFAHLVSRVATAWTCIDINDNILAAMPPYIVKGTEPQAPLSWITNPQPEVYSSWFDFAKQLFFFFQLGEAFIWATSRYANGYPRTFVTLRPDWVNVEFVGATRRYYLQGADITPDVLHIRYLTVPGNARGIGPLDGVARQMISSEMMDKYTTETLSAGGVPWSVLQFPDELSDAQVDDIHQRWITARCRSMGAPAVISGGFELKPMSFNAREMALLDLRSYTETRIAVALGVPPYLAGLTEGQGTRLTYSNVSQLFDYHWRAGLGPKATAVMTALSNWLLPAGTNVELNRDDYVRAPLETRATTYSTMFNIVDPITGQRAMEVPEIRAAERLGPANNPVAPAVLTGAAPPAGFVGPTPPTPAVAPPPSDFGIGASS